MSMIYAVYRCNNFFCPGMKKPRSQCRRAVVIQFRAISSITRRYAA